MNLPRGEVSGLVRYVSVRKSRMTSGVVDVEKGATGNDDRYLVAKSKESGTMERFELRSFSGPTEDHLAQLTPLITNWHLCKNTTTLLPRSIRELKVNITVLLHANFRHTSGHFVP